MLVLALDTATPTLVAGLARWTPEQGAEVLAERAVPSGNRHAELLTPAISSVLDDAGLTMGDLDAVVTGLGPGPFTGLRVGVVTSAGATGAPRRSLNAGSPTYGPPRSSSSGRTTAGPAVRTPSSS